MDKVTFPQIISNGDRDQTILEETVDF